MNAPFSTSKPRHFLDLSDHDGATLKAIIADAKKRKLTRGQKPKGMPDTDQRVASRLRDQPARRVRGVLQLVGIIRALADDGPTGAEIFQLKIE